MKNPKLWPITISLALLQLVLVSILLVVLLTACTEPTPTQLADDPNKSNILTLEVIAEKPGIYVYSNGYDSTGILQPVLDKSTVIYVTGIRNTNYGKRTLDDYFFAQFSDKGKPVYNKDKNLLGFVGMNMGEVQFNNSSAKPMENKVSFHDHGNEHGVEKDTTMGIKYIYSTKLNSKTAPPNFPYNSSVSFKLNQGPQQNHGQQIQLDIPTPKEIIGDVLIQGKSAEKNLKVSLAWNGQSAGQVDVVIGKVQSSTSPLPLFKITGNDDGKMILPQSIIDKLASVNSKELVITLIRKKIKEGAGTILNDNYIIAQSIHNIKIQLP